MNIEMLLKLFNKQTDTQTTYSWRKKSIVESDFARLKSWKRVAIIKDRPNVVGRTVI